MASGDHITLRVNDGESAAPTNNSASPQHNFTSLIPISNDSLTLSTTFRISSFSVDGESIEMEDEQRLRALSAPPMFEEDSSILGINDIAQDGVVSIISADNDGSMDESVLVEQEMKDSIPASGRSNTGPFVIRCNAFRSLYLGVEGWQNHNCERNVVALEGENYSVIVTETIIADNSRHESEISTDFSSHYFNILIGSDPIEFGSDKSISSLISYSESLDR